MKKILTLYPSTIYVSLPPLTKVVSLFCSKKGLYFFRFLDGKTTSVKINIPHPGCYKINTGNVYKVTPIEITPLDTTEPTPDRQREKKYIVKHNSYLKGSPARNFTHQGIIETGLRFYDFPFPLRVFILLHEVAHFKYSKEEDCDLWAAIQFIKMGYNNSTALYALTKVLKQSDANEKRILQLFKNLNK